MSFVLFASIQLFLYLCIYICPKIVMLTVRTIMTVCYQNLMLFFKIGVY